MGPNGKKISSAYLRAQGTASAEVQAVAEAGLSSSSSTAYLNLESGGDCHGEPAAIRALIQGKVNRVVMGIRHPLSHSRGIAVKALREAGIRVDVIGEARLATEPEEGQDALEACLKVNEPLLHRAVLKRPLSLLKYAMTLDGKIATSSGHSAWVTSPPARAMVFEQRGRSDAVIVGGNTVRRDNPRLTTRREDKGCHAPVRVVMSRTLDLPPDAELWDVTIAPTIVMTQKGAKRRFQDLLRQKGVEVVEFDFLTPENVADYCYDRGFLQCFWECGGVLSAPCISGNVIHKVMAFVAPKIIGGGDRAPSPVGELGFVEMTQAVGLVEIQWRQVGPDLCLMGYLPTSNGPKALDAVLSGQSPPPSLPSLGLPPSSSSQPSSSTPLNSSSSLSAPAELGVGRLRDHLPPLSSSSSGQTRERGEDDQRPVSTFYKAWDKWGSLGNFSPHPFKLSLSCVEEYSPSPSSSMSPSELELAHAAASPQEWRSVEHYYQASKFTIANQEGRDIVEQVRLCLAPEDAARLGRLTERTRPDLLRPSWGDAKVAVMRRALKAKFTEHEGPREMLRGSRGMELVESSPHDFVWGRGYNGRGRNQLGRLLMEIREELFGE